MLFLVAVCSLANAALTTVTRVRLNAPRVFSSFHDKLTSPEPFVLPLAPGINFNDHCHSLIDYSRHHEHWADLKKDIITAAASPRTITQLRKVGGLRAKALPFSEEQVSKQIVPFIEELDKELKFSGDLEKVAETVAEEKDRILLLMQARTFDVVMETLDYVESASRAALIDELSPVFRQSLFREMNAMALYVRLCQEFALLRETKWVNFLLKTYQKACEDLSGTGRTHFNSEEFQVIMEKYILENVEDEAIRKDLGKAVNILLHYRATGYEIVGSLTNE